MQTPTQVLNIGADVAKDEIVVACSEGSFPVRKLANQRTALLAFLKSLPPGSRIGMESTGIYNELFANLAHKLGFIVFVLNPKDARHYAKGVGLRGKTDRVDAELHRANDRARTYQATRLDTAYTRATRNCSTAQTSRQAEFLASGTGHVAQGSGSDLKPISRCLRARFDQVISHIDQRVKALIDASPERKEHVTHLRTIYGVGPVVSAALVNTLERVPLKSCRCLRCVHRPGSSTR